MSTKYDHTKGSDSACLMDALSDEILEDLTSSTEQQKDLVQIFQLNH
jgi:hypothetical protein